MVQSRYKQAQVNHILFIKHQGDTTTALIVYADDIVVTGNDEMEVARLKSMLAKEFKIKVLGTLRYLLRIKVVKSTQGIFLSQSKYVLDLLQEAGMTSYKPCVMPIEANHRLKDVSARLINVGRYQRLVAKLIYLALTQPNITNVVSICMHQPRTI